MKALCVAMFLLQILMHFLIFGLYVVASSKGNIYVETGLSGHFFPATMRSKS